MSYEYDDHEWDENEAPEDVDFGPIPSRDHVLLSTFVILPLSRILHDDQQVLSPDQLEIGKHYERHAKNGSVTIIQIASDPYLTIDSYVVDYWYEDDDRTFLRSVYLADCGILAYSGGTWNLWNYLVPIE